MTETQGSDQGEHGLAEARLAIARQAEEIAELRRRLDDEHVARELRDILTETTLTDTIVAPVTHDELLETILHTASQVISARTASLFRLDSHTGALNFEAAVGEHADEMERLDVPFDEGIAVLVASSAQPMTISPSAHDPGSSLESAQSTEYRPTSLLCVPLFYGERVVGVLELLDKEGADAFGSKDIDALALLGNLAGVAMEQSRRQQSLTTLVEHIVHSLGTESDDERKALARRARDFAERTEDDSAFDEMMATAGLVRAIVAHGPGAARALHTMLEGFAGYVQSRGASTGSQGGV